MIKKIILSLVMIILVSSLLAEKSLERLGNEAAYAGDEAFNAGNRAEAANKYEEAIEKFKAANEKDGIPVQDKIDGIYDKLFKAYYFSGSYLKSIAVLKIQLKEDPNSSKIARTIAQIYDKKLKDLDMAIQTLVDFNNKKVSYIVQKKIASYYTDKEDYANAIVWYEKASEQKQDSRVIKNIASLYLKLDQKDNAVAAYENIIKTNPKKSVLVKTYKKMGALYDEMNNSEKAIYYYNKSIELKFNEQIAFILLDKYYGKQDYSKANTIIEILLRKYPGNTDAIYYRAMIHYDLGNKEEAKADFEIIKANPKYTQIAKGFIESIESE